MHKTQSTLWATALRGLAHPWALAAIILLLVNDHMLKQTVPSVLTGKLSDFAGLFFFPFLLAAAWGVLAGRRRPAARRGALLIFALSGLAFAAIKTLPWANALAVQALTCTIGPAQIVRDPTDLIALLVLWPAWHLWRRLEDTPATQAPGKRAYVALALASLATMATSCAPILRVHSLAIAGDRVYARLAETHDPDLIIAQSDDGGRTWQNADLTKVPQAIIEELQQPISMPYTDCDPQTPDVCYRISDTDIVETSADGGRTWNIAWQIPPGRRVFAERYRGSMAPCGRAYEFEPSDLALLPTATGMTVIVATGSEGVLVRLPDGAWRQFSVLTINPTPFESNGFEIMALATETVLIITGALVTGIALTIVAWNKFLRGTGRSSAKSILPAIGGVLFAAMLVGLLFLLPGVDGLMYVVLLGVPGAILVGLSLSWGSVKRTSTAPEAVGLAQWICTLTPLGMLFAEFFFILWTSGTIAHYEAALALAIATLAGVLLAGAILLARIPAPAFTSESQGTLSSQSAGLTGLPFLSIWIVIHLVGSTLSSPLAHLFVVWTIPGSVVLYLLAILNSLIFVGLQWLVVQRYHRALRWWVPVTLLGYLAYGAIERVFGVFATLIPHGNATTFITAAIAGAVIGVAQWLLLRQWRTRAGWWIAACVVNTEISNLLATYNTSAQSIPGFVLLGIQGILSGLITGLTFLWLTRQPQPDSEEALGTSTPDNLT